MSEPANNNQKTQMDSATDVRAELIDFVCTDLIGPAHGVDEVIEDPPHVKYSAAVLFPRELLVDESGSVGGVEANGTDDRATVFDDDTPNSDSPPQENSTNESDVLNDNNVDAYDDSVTLANRYKPSAIALTFALPDSAQHLKVTVRAAIYKSGTRLSADGQQQNQEWRRQELKLDPFVMGLPEKGIVNHTVTDGLKFCLFVGHSQGRRIVTASLYNDTSVGAKNAETFYQSGFTLTCVDPDCEFSEYFDSEHTTALDDEELALEMLYRDRHSFAIGHGCAAYWTEGQNGGAKLLRTESIPRVIVPPVEPREGKDRYLNMKFLQGTLADSDKDISKELYLLCFDYEHWIKKKEDATLTEIPERYKRVASTNLRLCRTVLNRIRQGIETIENDPIAMDAFKFANRAILMQQYHSRLQVRPLDADPESLPSWEDYPERYWRTFQLAFILMTIPGIVDETDSIRLNDKEVKTRDLVDLIWFPTGGGKTEAYLGLSAFLIFFTRFRDPTTKGCKVLMRYTLRLLTSQQFQRASSLICACELIRARNSDQLGDEPITIGLWVGKSLTPNNELSAARAITSLSKKEREGKNPFQLLSCPWCKTTLTDKRQLGYVLFKGHQRFVCPNSGESSSSCLFSTVNNPLPVCVVDELIYKRPPTLLIGTVDKFAMLAWNKKAGVIFRDGGGPDLIIQDELHLISGPLGSMVGLYESVIDHLCSNGSRPKIIASTATIRRAREQCMSLYARPMFQFPQPGIDASDSFFAKENTNSPGRLYAGFLPTAASSGLTAQVRSVVALLQGIFLLQHNLPSEWIDPYFTIVQYFGSLKELGRAATFVKADIPEFLPTMHRSYGLSKDDDPDRRRYLQTSEELTSRRNEDEIPKILMRLEKRYDPDGRYDSQALDTVLATNMISVGVDVDRLGLMMVVTQPKGTSEYIQASSRVGRSSESPGLVFTLYSAGRPRDRSHYEQFRPYHDAFYRHVEPTSVTPFSPPALERALHAILVIAGRQIVGWESPKKFDRTNAKFKEFVSFLLRRAQLVDPDHAQEFKNILERRLCEWENSNAEAWGNIVQCADTSALMRPAGRPKSNTVLESWEVPTSMRNVDTSCGAVVVQYPCPDE